MAAIQPALDGTLPTPTTRPARERAADYETWITAVRPAYEQAAASGKPFTTYSIADTNKLPEPPDPAHHWGRLMTLLKDEGWIRKHGWTCSTRPTTHQSGVRVWIGTRAARTGRAA